MDMDYDFAASAFQRVTDCDRQHPSIQPHLGYQEQYVGHPFPQSHVAECPRGPAQNQGSLQPHQAALDMAGHALNNDFEASASANHFDIAYTGFDKGYGFTPSGVLLTPQESESASSPLNCSDVPMRSQGAINHQGLPIQTFNAENGAFNAPPRRQQNQLRRAASSVSMGDNSSQRRAAGAADEAGNSSEPIDKRASSGEENDDSVQGRRKAQNRAAQRAFRERKERRVRDLEQELADYKQKLASMMESNELLKQQMAKVNTENEILKATSEHHRRYSHHRRHRHHSSQRSISSSSGSGSSHSPHRHHDEEPTKTGPMRYFPVDYAPEKSTHRTFVCPETGEKLLTAGATWDLIVQTLESRGLTLDVQGIYAKLSLHTRCDGQGPVIQESKVKEAIEQSVLEGDEEMI